MDSGCCECQVPFDQLSLTSWQDRGELKVVLVEGQHDDATGTVRIRDPLIVAFREDHSAGVGHDASEGVDRQNGAGGVAAALARAGDARVRYRNMMNLERSEKRTSVR